MQLIRFFVLVFSVYMAIFAIPAQAQIIVPSTHNISGTDNYIEITKPSGTAGDALMLNSTGHLGINNTSPVVPVDVGGEVKLGDHNLTCNATYEGVIRYNSATKEIEVCSGVDGWTNYTNRAK
jgi:hypothetical protein